MLQAEQVLQERYQLKQKLGHNAGRQTWLAEDLQASPPELIVIKLLTFGGDMQWDDLKLFEREAQVLKQLDHPRIPKYRDYFSIDDRTLWFGLIQDYIPGTCLKDLLTQGRRFTERQVRDIALQVLQILTSLHALHPPVLHRDIKPSNLIWGADDQVYLVDFGAVQDRAATEGATFTVVGTYGYAPVEQFGGRTVPASDLYALGATLIHLLTGLAPADLPQRRMRLQFSDRINLSASFTSWLEAMIAPDLEERFSTAEAALNALKAGRGLSTASHTAVATEAIANSSGQGLQSKTPIPKEIIGWNWGAFLLTPYWALAHRTWIGLFSLAATSSWGILYFFSFGNPWIFKAMLAVSLATELWIMVKLGRQGNQLAWQKVFWQSTSQFKAHQRNWAIAGFFIGVPFVLWAWIGRIFMLFRF
jgi:serine/threonine protein kinase